MSRPPSSGRPATLIQRVGRAYAPPEWELLTTLPRTVLVAAADVGRRGAAAGGVDSGAVADGLAALAALAAGRSYDSDLVRAVVAAIFAEDDPDVAGTPGRAPPGVVFARCRRAAAVLAARADPADSAAYRHWVQQIAVRALGPGADATGPTRPDRMSAGQPGAGQASSGRANPARPSAPVRQFTPARLGPAASAASSPAAAFLARLGAALGMR